MDSGKCELNSKDLKKFGLNILFFNVPTFLLIFVTALSQGLDVLSALMTAGITFLTALVDLGKKFVEDHGKDNKDGQ